MSAQPEHVNEPVSSSSLKDLYGHHSRMILSTAWRITGKRDDAEDVLQLIFLRLLKSRSLDLEAVTGGYLRRAAVNASLDIVRNRGKHQDQSSLEESMALRDTGNGDNPEEILRGHDLADALCLALSRLNKRAAEVFVLREIEGLTNDKTAELLGTTPNTVTVTLHRARTRLLEMLSSWEGFTAKTR